jgi:hypothetical protein
LSIALRVPLTTSVLIDLSLLVFNGILVSWLVYDSSAIQEQTMVKMQQDQSGLRFAISNTHAIVARVDTDLRYVWIQNPHPTFDPNEMIGKRDDELNPGTGSEKLMALKKRTLNSQMSHLERISGHRCDDSGS